ncbi:MAG TPA: bifunctional UDP-N-acetylglucosamine diphosphorylase/glucosamine-1-phosphate N-acetyltransferase GlmU [Alphaproteobacteria bacterium]
MTAPNTTPAVSFACIILAAGKGTRMISDTPKLMHKVAHKPLLQHVIDSCVAAGSSEVIVVAAPHDQLTQGQAAPHDQLTQGQAAPHRVAIQQIANGTATAALAGVEAIKGKHDKVLILNGDMPLLKPETILRFAHQEDPLGLMVMELPDGRRLGRVILNKDNRVVKIVEFKDATPEERDIKIIVSGVYAMPHDKIADILGQIDNNNAAQEYYLTEYVAIGQKMGLDCGITIAEWNEVASVNNRTELAEIELLLQNRLRQKFMDAGVTLIDPNSVFFATDTQISNDVIIEPNVFIGPGVSIAKNAHIKAFSHIEGATIGEGAEVGPFARLRPGTTLAEKAKAGNFVEIKNATIGAGSKISHLTYVGDATIGTKCNIGAGVVTCNYDGFSKFKTTIGDNAFVGAHSTLIAPVTVGDNAITAAGSVITEDVSADTLAITRAEQKNIEQGAVRYRDKRRKAS